MQNEHRMAGVTAWGKVARLLGAANRQIFANASALMGTMVVTSGFGALYWLVAARLFTTETVGLSGASIAMMSLLGTAGMLGLGTLLIGELPRQRGQEAALIATALAVAGSVGAALGVLFAVVAPLIAPNLRDLSGSVATVALFALGVSLTSITMVLDQALLGLLRGSLQLWRNAGFAAVKLVVLAILALWLGGDSWLTVYGTWVLGHLLSLVGLAAFAAWRGIWPDWHSLRPRAMLLRRFGRAALWHHGLNMALQLPGLTLPVLVTSLLSATDNAYYYASSIVATPFFYGTLALVTALYAVGSRSPAALAERMRFTLRLALAAAVAGNLVLLVGADLLLNLFGGEYADRAAWTLRILGLCVFPIIVKDHFVTLNRIHNRLAGTATLAAAGTAAELLLATLGARIGGLPGLVTGWLIALTLEAIVMAPAVYRAARQIDASEPEVGVPPAAIVVGGSRADQGHEAA